MLLATQLEPAAEEMHFSAMRKVSRLKGAGYLTSTLRVILPSTLRVILPSTLSVILLAAVAWKSAVRDPVLFVCLFLGAATSIAGMTLRWTSHRLEQREKSLQTER